MPKYTAIAVQEVAENQNVILTDAIRCNRGNVLHNTGSGQVTLRGITNQCFARYRVSFGGNVAIPTGGTAQAITIALSLNGEASRSALGITTPAAADQYGNIYIDDIVDVPRGCCLTLAVKNLTEATVNVQNGNLIIERIA